MRRRRTTTPISVPPPAPAPAPAPSPTPTPTPSALFPWRTAVNMQAMGGAPDFLPGSLNGAVFFDIDSHWDYYAAKGMDHCRIECNWERLQPSLMGALGEQDFTDPYFVANRVDPTYGDLIHPVNMVNKMIGSANARGQKVVLDLCHNYGQRYIGYVHGGAGDGWGSKTQATLGSGSLTSAHLADYCKKIAQTFGSLPGVVAMEIMNEPHDLVGGEAYWTATVQACINAIRSVNSTIIIIANGYAWENADFYTFSPTLHTVSDPANRLMFSCHQYMDQSDAGFYSGSEATGPNTGHASDGTSRFQIFLNWLKDKGKKGRIGECGIPSTTAWRAPFTTLCDMARTAGVPISLHGDFGPDNDPNILQTFPNGAPDRVSVQVLAAEQIASWGTQ